MDNFTTVSNDPMFIEKYENEPKEKKTGIVVNIHSNGTVLIPEDFYDIDNTTGFAVSMHGYCYDKIDKQDMILHKIGVRAIHKKCKKPLNSRDEYIAENINGFLQLSKEHAESLKNKGFNAIEFFNDYGNSGEFTMLAVKIDTTGSEE